MGHIDPIGRAAFGVLCLAAMAVLAMPALVVAGVVGGIVFWSRGDVGKALLVGLGTWGVAAIAGVLFLVIVYTAWPLAADWITEWPGYATGFLIAGASLGLMALLLLAIPTPLYVALIAPPAGSFAVGFGVAGWLGGLRAPGAQPRERARVLRRR